MTTGFDAASKQDVEPPHQLVAPILELTRKREFERAAAEADVLLQHFPQSFALLSLAVSANAQCGKAGKAEECARRALSLDPQTAGMHHNLGMALRAQGRVDEAIAAFERAIRLDETLVMAHLYRGLMLLRKGDLNNASPAFDRVIGIQPDFAVAHYYRGVVLAAKGEHRAAVAAHAEAIRLRPNFPEAYNDQGVVLLSLLEVDAAAIAFQNALHLKPDFALAYENLGTAFAARKDLIGAIGAFDRAFSLNPSSRAALSQKLHAQAQICDFTATDSASIEAVGIETSPLPMFSLEDNPERQRERAVFQWKRRAGSVRPLPLPARPESRPVRLRVGYFSSDFHEHATLRLMSGLIRDHDRSRFEIFVYSHGRDKSGPLRARVEQDHLSFFDVQQLTDQQVVSMARLHKLDIAIDLKGYTSGSRSELFGYRLAPIQMNYLGFPGTMATEAMDYIIADKTVIPDEFRHAYSESMLFLPHTYQPNDNQREIAATSTSRADFGLPEKAFVFCCFNNSFKISSAEFDIWMRLLSKVDGSVLWLVSSNVWMEQNLRKEAAARGIAPDRLVFSDKISCAEHLARHKHADLFLDTFNYNAHTTTSDALWAGLPVVTMPGRQFSARVAASLLNAVGLPELVTSSKEEYEQKILDLATQPKELKRIRDRLARNRLSQPLFDTARYTKNFEAGLLLTYDRYFDGKQPADIVVSDAIDRS